MAPDLEEIVFGVVGVTPAVLRGVYACLPSDLLDDPVDDGWSPRHVLAHLLDTEDVIFGRLRRIVAEDRPFIQSIDAPARVNQSGYLAHSIDSLLSKFEGRRIENIEWLRKLSAAHLARLGEHDTAGEISAADHAYQ
jgi:DinB superfamily